MKSNKTIQFHTTKPNAIGSRIFSTVFGLFFIGIPLFITVFIVRDFLQRLEEQGWKETACQIVASRVEQEQNDSHPFTFKVEYSYDFNGQPYTSSVWRRGGESIKDSLHAQSLTEKYRAGQSAVCRINPDKPDEAVLETGTLAIGWAMLFPLPFIAIGAGVIFFGWKNSGPQQNTPDSQQVALSRKVRAGQFGLMAFMSIFLIIGLLILHFMFIKPLLNTIDSQHWVETPCVVVSSRVVEHSDDDGSTYSVDILYQYQFNDRDYHNNRYNFSSGSSSGRGAKQQIVNRYPPGAETTCWVDPDDPQRSVLVRKMGREVWFIFLPLVFIAVGGGGMIAVWKKSPVAKTADTDWHTYHDVNSPVKLSCAAARMKKSIGCLFIALFWNGITAVFVTIAVKSHIAHRPEWLLTIFIIPFVIVGLIIIIFLLKSLLALFNTAVTLEIAPGHPQPGVPVTLSWEIARPSYRLKELTIWLEGREEVTVSEGGGKNRHSHTSKNVFYKKELARSLCQMAPIGSDRVQFTVPDSVMHSFKLGSTAVVWELHVKGDVTGWPDIDDSYKLIILPPAAEEHKR